MEFLPKKRTHRPTTLAALKALDAQKAPATPQPDATPVLDSAGFADAEFKLGAASAVQAWAATSPADLAPGETLIDLLIGIGGVSMSPLAEVLHDAGLDIRGSDMAESSNTLTLRERGIPKSDGTKGDLLATVNLDTVKQAGFDTTVMLTVTNTAALSAVTPHTGIDVSAGQTVIDVEH